MLKIQTFLHNGGTFDKLKEQYGINTKVSDDQKLVIFNYDQIDSPKYVELVEECRGLVLENNTWKTVAKTMTRFYNYGERPSFDGTFKIEKAKVLEKLDGSLILLYNYDNQWRINTRNSFGQGKINDLIDLTWSDLFFSTIDNTKLDDLNQQYTYIFELCSVHNKIVVHYPEPKSYLLTIINNTTHEEEDDEFIARHASLLNTNLPQTFAFTNILSLLDHIKEYPGQTFEGVVAKYKHHRLKFKNPLYVSLHHLRGNNGSNINSIKHIVPILLAGEVDEICAVFPEYEEMLRKFEASFVAAKKEISELWEQTKHISNQKVFAQQVVKSEWNTILFSAKKSNKNPLDILTNHENLFIKKLKG